MFAELHWRSRIVSLIDGLIMSYVCRATLAEQDWMTNLGFRQKYFKTFQNQKFGKKKQLNKCSHIRGEKV